jgi:hypothetical protein
MKEHVAIIFVQTTQWGKGMSAYKLMSVKELCTFLIGVTSHVYIEHD